MVHSSKWLMSLILVITLVFTSGTAFAQHETNQTTVINNPTVNVFIDVPREHWASEAIRSMYEKGVVSGYPDGSFGVHDPITREQFAKMLVLTFGLDTVTPDTQTFIDVNPDKWSYSFIETAKEYLTGYFPPNGRPSFDPGSPATREDVAVALVKVMGLNEPQAGGSGDFMEEPINGEQLLSSRFSDWETISPRLVNEVATAVENKLINGFPDGTFRGEQPIDRASVATLLYRAIKSSYTQATQDPFINLSMPDKVSSTTLNVSGSVNKDAKLYINSSQVKVSDGRFSEIFPLNQGEGTYDFEFKVVLSNGRSKVEKKQVILEVKGPTLTVNCPETAEKQTIKITGTVKDSGDFAPDVTVNGSSAYVSNNGGWSKEVTLKDGINKLVITATNNQGKQTVIEKTVQFNAKGSSLMINELPQSTNNKTITISGKVTDPDDREPNLYLNNEQLYVASNGTFSKSYTLADGENTLNFKVVNSLGKITEVTKKVVLSISGPNLVVDSCPQSSNQKTIRVSGSVKDSNDGDPYLYVNDNYIYVNNNGTFSVTVQLKAGDNTLVFKAVNRLGKSTTITKTVTFSVAGPILTIDSCPETSSQKNLRVSGRVSDANDSSPDLTLNSEYVYVNGNGTFTAACELAEGENTLTFKAVNNLGIVTTVTKKVVFNAGGSNIVVEGVPETANKKSLVVTGRVSDPNDNYPSLYINDEQIYLGSGGNFSKSLALTEGQNTLVFKAVNRLGKATTITKTVAFTVPVPVIEASIPDTSNKNFIEIKGKITDSTYAYEALTLTINGRNVSIDRYSGSWSYTVELNEGQNTITLTGTNPLGRQTSVQRLVSFTIVPPTLNATVPETSSTDTIQISGNVSDSYDTAPTVQVDGVSVPVNSSGNWNVTKKLVEGTNTITITAANKYGKTATVTKTVTYTNPSAPQPEAPAAEQQPQPQTAPQQ